MDKESRRKSLQVKKNLKDKLWMKKERNLMLINSEDIEEDYHKKD